MKIAVIPLLIVFAVAGCTQKPAPVASEAPPAESAERLALTVEYVAIPVMSVYARPALDAPVVTTYGLMEAVSILEERGEWCMVRTFEGSGWARREEMVDGTKAAEIDTLSPRFYIEPEEIPDRAYGEIWLQARVNTDGEVIEVKPIRNTTGSQALANANAEALRKAKFYPVIDKGTRKMFTYEHRVYY
jgi:hypothetical protein